MHFFPVKLLLLLRQFLNFKTAVLTQKPSHDEYQAETPPKHLERCVRSSFSNSAIITDKAQ